jgi:hypothetical protein
MKLTLGTDSEDRKNIPVFSGVLKYAPAAIAGVARVSKAGNDKHNPGEELHHSRGKSMDHGDCIVRHAMDVADIEAHIKRNHSASPIEWWTNEDAKALLNEVSQLAWRALMWSQELHERYVGAPLAPGARPPSSASQPPIDNAHVAPGCELFANSPSGWANDKLKIEPGDKITIAEPRRGAGAVEEATAGLSEAAARAAKWEKQDAAAKKRQESY